MTIRRCKMTQSIYRGALLLLCSTAKTDNVQNLERFAVDVRSKVARFNHRLELLVSVCLSCNQQLTF